MTGTPFTRPTFHRPSMRLISLLLALVVLAPLASCHRGKPKVAPSPRREPAAPAGPVDDVQPVDAADRLYYDDTQVFTDSSRITIRDPETLEEFWSRAGTGQATTPPLPAIDWNHEMVLLVSAGRLRPGDQIRVDSAGMRNGSMVAIVRTTVECQPFPATAYPFEIVRVPRSEGPVQFVERSSKSADCR